MKENSIEINVIPSHTLVFQRNQLQIIASISIERIGQYNRPVSYTLQSTHKDGYIVSKTKGQLKKNQKYISVSIEMKKDQALEQRLMDRFRLSLWVNGELYYQKTLKVSIISKNIQGVVQSRLPTFDPGNKTDRSNSTAFSSMSSALSLVSQRRSQAVKVSKLSEIPEESRIIEEINMKIEVTELLKAIEQKKMKLQYLQSAIRQNISKKKIGRIVTFLVLLTFLTLGAITRIIISNSSENYVD